MPFLTDARKAYPTSLLVHAGPLFYEDAGTDAKKKGQQARQAEVVADLVGRTRFDVAGATLTDEVASGVKLGALGQRAKVELTAANLSIAGETFEPRVVKAIGGLRVGIFALASPTEVSESTADARVTDPEAAAASAVAALSREADVVVLLSGLGLRETKRLVRKVPGIQFAIAGGMGEHPSVSEEAELVGETRVLQFHREGRYVGRLTVRLVPGKAGVGMADVSGPSDAEVRAMDDRIARLEQSLASWAKTRPEDDHDVRSARHHLAALKDERAKRAGARPVAPSDRSSFSFALVPLNWDLPQDPSTVEIMKAFDEELARINVANAGTLPAAKPGEATYVGVDACFECHEDTRTFWKATAHSRAWETLERDGKTFDTECVSCHVTGYGKATGSLVGHTQGREDVQCEACHGPGSLHCEDGDVAKLVEKPVEATCVVCHNKHHAPNFVFTTHRPKLLVPGHGKPLR